MLETLSNLPPAPRVFVALFVLRCLVGAFFWLATAFYLLRIPFNAKPNSLQGWLPANPLNLVFYGDRLTPKGLLIRKRLIISIGGFFASLALGCVFYWIAMALI